MPTSCILARFLFVHNKETIDAALCFWSGDWKGFFLSLVEELSGILLPDVVTGRFIFVLSEGTDSVYFCSWELIEFTSVPILWTITLFVGTAIGFVFFLRGLLLLVKLCSKELEYLAKRLGTGEHSVILGSVRVPLCAYELARFTVSLVYDPPVLNS